MAATSNSSKNKKSSIKKRLLTKIAAKKGATENKKSVSALKSKTKSTVRKVCAKIAKAAVVAVKSKKKSQAATSAANPAKTLRSKVKKIIKSRKTAKPTINNELFFAANTAKKSNKISNAKKKLKKVAVSAKDKIKKVVTTRRARSRKKNDILILDQQSKDDSVRLSELDPTQIYLKEIGYKPLLSAKEELKLAKLVQKNNKKATHKMIESNLRLVVKIARHYCNRGLDFLDLIAEGNVGLMTAVKKFDPSRKLRFSTYGTWWIRQTIERAIMNQSRTVRLPVHVIKEMNIYLRAGKKLMSGLDHEPTAQEIADLIDKPVADIERMLNMSASQTSLDTPLGEDSSSTLADTIACKNNIDPASLVGRDDFKLRMQAWVDKLDTKQRHIIIRRYGLNGREKETLESIAKDTGLTREKVRTIQLDGVKKLRNLMLQEGLSNDDAS